MFVSFCLIALVYLFGVSEVSCGINTEENGDECVCPFSMLKWVRRRIFCVKELGNEMNQERACIKEAMYVCRDQPAGPEFLADYAGTDFYKHCGEKYCGLDCKGGVNTDYCDVLCMTDKAKAARSIKDLYDANPHLQGRSMGGGRRKNTGKQEGRRLENLPKGSYLPKLSGSTANNKRNSWLFMRTRG